MTTEVDAGRGDEDDEIDAEQQVIRELMRYRDAALFRRRAGQALRAVELSFASWRVLDATVRLVLHKGDACCQADVARELALDQASVLRTMRLLAERGWVNHDVGDWKLGFRVIPTEEGRARSKRGHATVAGTFDSQARWLRRLDETASAWISPASRGAAR